jgi:hypothetical protein
VFGGTVTGFVNGDSQSSATTGTLVFNSSATATSNVGSYAVTGSGLSANNYTFVQAAGNSVALTINPISVTESLTGTVTKPFDNTNTATLAPANYAPLSGVRSGDTVTLASFPATGTYDNPQTGTGKVVTVTGLSLAGASAGNYSLASSIISAPIGVITASAPSSTLLSVTSAQVQATPVLDAAVNSSIVALSRAASVPAPNEAPAAQIASLTIASPLESLTTADSGAQALEPPTSAEAATNYIIDSMNGAPSGAATKVDVIIPGVLRAVSGRRPLPPATGDNLSAWGNPALWQ